MAAVDLDEFAGVHPAFAPLAMGATTPVALPLPVGDEPAAQRFGVEGKRVVFGQHLGGQGGAEVGIVDAHQGQRLGALEVGFAMCGGVTAQPMHQAGITHRSVPFPDAVALAVGQRQQRRHLHQTQCFLADLCKQFQPLSFL